MYKLTYFLLAFTLVIGSCKSDNSQTANGPTPTFDQVSETESIMSIIENETSCFYARDYECWKAHFAHTDLSLIHI